MPAEACTIDFNVPQIVTYTYGAIYMLLLMLVGIQSFHMILKRIVSVRSDPETIRLIQTSPHDMDFNDGNINNCNQKKNKDDSILIEEASPRDHESNTTGLFKLELMLKQWPEEAINYVRMLHLENRVLRQENVMLQSRVQNLSSIRKNNINLMQMGMNNINGNHHKYNHNDNQNHRYSRDGVRTVHSPEQVDGIPVPEVQTKCDEQDEKDIIAGKNDDNYTCKINYNDGDRSPLDRNTKQTNDGFTNRNRNTKRYMEESSSSGSESPGIGDLETRGTIIGDGEQKTAHRYDRDYRGSESSVTIVSNDGSHARRTGLATNAFDTNAYDKFGEKFKYSDNRVVNCGDYNESKIGNQSGASVEHAHDTDDKNHIDDGTRSDDHDDNKENDKSENSSLLVLSAGSNYNYEEDGEDVCSICFESIAFSDKLQDNVLHFDCVEHRCIHKDCGMLIQLKADYTINCEVSDARKSRDCPICKEIAFIPPPAVSFARQLFLERAKTITIIKRQYSKPIRKRGKNSKHVGKNNRKNSRKIQKLKNKKNENPKKKQLVKAQNNSKHVANIYANINANANHRDDQNDLDYKNDEADDEKFDKSKIRIQRSRSLDVDLRKSDKSNKEKVRFFDAIGKSNPNKAPVPRLLPIAKEGKSFKENVFDSEGLNQDADVSANANADDDIDLKLQESVASLVPSKSLAPGADSIGQAISSSSIANSDVASSAPSVIFIKSQLNKNQSRSKPNVDASVAIVHDANCVLHNGVLHNYSDDDSDENKVVDDDDEIDEGDEIAIKIGEGPNAKTKQFPNKDDNDNENENDKQDQAKYNIALVELYNEHVRALPDPDAAPRADGNYNDKWKGKMDEEDDNVVVKIEQHDKKNAASNNDASMDLDQDDSEEGIVDHGAQFAPGYNYNYDFNGPGLIVGEEKKADVIVEIEMQMLMGDNNAVAYSDKNNQINSIIKEMSRTLTPDDVNTNIFCTFCCNKKIVKFWVRDVWNKRKCYFPLFTHFIDQMTDIGVLVELYLLYVAEQQHGANFCQNINPISLFVASMIAFLFYRIVSAVVILKQTKDLKRFFYQLLDLELYRALYLNYKLNAPNPTNPQRWIQSLESVLEAFPQTLIQLFIVVKIGSSATTLVLFSFLMSLWSIISKTISEDKLLFEPAFQRIRLRMTKLQHWKENQCVSYKYLSRVAFRIIDILNRILTLFLVWILIGGFTVSCILCLELCFLVIISFITKNSSILAWILKFPFETPETFPRVAVLFQFWRWISHFALISVVWIMSLTNFNLYCNGNQNSAINICADNDMEQSSLFFKYLAVRCSLYFCTIACVVLPIAFIFYIKSRLRVTVVTVDRTLKELLKLQDWRGISELVEFGFIFDKQEYLEILFHPNSQYFGYETLWKILWIIETKYGLNVLELDLNQAQINSLLMIVSNILQLDEQDSWMLLESLTNFQKLTLKEMLKNIIRIIDSKQMILHMQQLENGNANVRMLDQYQLNTNADEEKNVSNYDDDQVYVGSNRDIIDELAIASYHRAAAQSTLQKIKQWNQFQPGVQPSNTAIRHHINIANNRATK